MEILIVIVLGLMSAGVLGILYVQAKKLIAKLVEKSENKVDDLIFNSLSGELDKLVVKGEEKLEEILEKKLEELRKKNDSESSD